jgi:hypothetical protein
MRARRLSLVGCAAALCSIAPACGQVELRLWPNGAAGSEEWPFPESVATSPSGDRVITNVSDPMLTVFLPDTRTATGAAAVIAPGGALRVLGFDNEGVKLAEWLNERGIAASCSSTEPCNRIRRRRALRCPVCRRLARRRGKSSSS